MQSRGDVDGKARVSVFQDLLVGQRTSMVNVQFQYNVSSDDVVSAVSGTGAVSHENNMAVVSTGAGIGSASITSKDALSYRPGFEGYAYYTAIFDTPQANTFQRIGPHDDGDGFYVGYEGLDFGVTRRSGGVDEFVTGEAFLRSIDGPSPGERSAGVSLFAHNPLMLNIFMLGFGWLGIAPIANEINGGAVEGWLQFQVFDKVNKLAETTIDTPVLPLRMRIGRTAGAGAPIRMKTASWNAGIIGTYNPHIGGRGRAVRNSKSILANTLTPIFSIKSTATFQTKSNHVTSLLEFISVAVDGTKPATAVVLRNATLPTGSFTDLDTTNSTLSIATSDATVTGGTEILSLDMGKVEGKMLMLLDHWIKMYPGDTFTLAVISTGASDVRASARFLELF